MRILWIGKQPSDGEAGDEVFDRKIIAACRKRGAVVELFHPARVSRIAELMNLASGQPHYRARYASAANRSAISAASRDSDVIICSWEPFDTLALNLDRPTLLILHNVTSQSLPQLFPANWIANLGAIHAQAWEREHYSRKTISAIGVLSRPDQSYLASLVDCPNLLWLPPGMPPVTPLNANAQLLPELVITGTYEWRPKYRDLMLFAKEYSTVLNQLPIRADKLPGSATALLGVTSLPNFTEAGEALRLGLISDRFRAGHKLKTLAYIANNQIVLSFADVTPDFVHLEDHRLFIRTLANIEDIALHVAELGKIPIDQLHKRFSAFKDACVAQFTWYAAADTLLNAARIAVIRSDT